MNSQLKKNPVLVTALIAVLTLVGGLAMAQGAQPAPGPGMGGGMGQPGGPGYAMYGCMQRHGKHGQGMQGGGYGKHGKRHGQHGQTHCGKHLFGGCWKKSLSDEQKARLDQLHINHARIKAPLKARIKVLKVDLAMLATAPRPDKVVIDAKIEALLKLKGKLLGAKYGYIAAQRQVLTPEQQISFDMEKVHGAMHGKQSMARHGAKH